MRADSSAMRSPSRSRSGGCRGLGGAALSLSAAVGATSTLVTAAAGCSVVENSGHAAGVGWRGRVMVSGAMPAWYTRLSKPPCWPVDGTFARFGLFQAEHRAAGPERAQKAEMRAESAGSGTWRSQTRNTMSNSIRPATGFFRLFRTVTSIFSPSSYVSPCAWMRTIVGGDSAHREGVRGRSSGVNNRQSGDPPEVSVVGE